MEQSLEEIATAIDSLDKVREKLINLGLYSETSAKRLDAAENALLLVASHVAIVDLGE